MYCQWLLNYGLLKRDTVPDGEPNNIWVHSMLIISIRMGKKQCQKEYLDETETTVQTFLNK